MIGRGKARASRAVGLGATAVIAAIYIVVAIRVQVPQETESWSDEWTYAMMAQSLALDGDLAYRAEDLRRVLAITTPGPAGGPQGVFLKPGLDVTGVEFTATPPFFRIRGLPDPETSRLFYGKAFIYPLVAAPFVAFFGLNGFLWLNAVLLAVSFFAAYTFLGARSGTLVSLLLAGAFVLATVVPVYYAWTMPELFNFTLGLVAYVCWLYKYVAPPPADRPGAAADTDARASVRRGLWSDVAAAALIGAATYSKVTDVLLFLPMAAWFIWRRDWRRTMMTSAAVVIVAGGFFAANVAVTGDWNYQGGPRNTFYQRSGNAGRAYPFQQPGVGFEAGGQMERSQALSDVIFDRDLFWLNLRSNLKYFVIGRYGGLLPYFFPAVLATLLFLAAGGRRQPWQWLVLGGLVAHILLFVITQPYTYLGSGGSVGNRYFMGAYGMSLFLFPPMTSVVPALAAWAVGAIFVGKIVLHPFYYSLRPFEPAKTGPLRLLPIELTNLNGLPVMNEGHRVRVPYGRSGAGDVGFQLYHFDDDAYLPEEDPHHSFWVKGRARAQMLIKTDTAFVYRTAKFALTAGPVPTDVTIELNGRTANVSLDAGETRKVALDLGQPFVYGFNKLESGQANYLWLLAITSSRGFTPPARSDGTPPDTRYLGVRVEPTIWP